MVAGVQAVKVAVIGAGWAGLSAAVELAERGSQVTLFEAGRVAGGRARGVAAQDFSFLDNGQHLLIGAYGAVFRLLKRLGVDIGATFMHQPLQWFLHDGVKFQAACLPAPWNVVWALLNADGAQASEKWALLRQFAVLRWQYQRGLPDESVENWLNKQNVAQKWRDEFWQPLVLGALNTPLVSASIRVLANVLADGVWQKRGDSSYCLPKVDLGALLVAPALRKLTDLGGQFVPETRVGQLQQKNGQIWVQNESFDRVVVAVAPYHVAPLLPDWGRETFEQAAKQWHYHAITTVYLRYAECPQLPVLMSGFANSVTQWLFDRQRINGEYEVAAVISVSDAYGSLKPQEWAQLVHQDVLRVSPHLGEPIAMQTITEKRATIAATPNRAIPCQNQLQEQGIWLAGDYLNANYPATLETAVQSGLEAAQGCWQSFQAA